MNSEQAKKLSLPDILALLGHLPTDTKKNGREYWYKSPFRNEHTASFHTSYLGGQWIWNDFGDIGGTVVDFAMRYKNTDVKGALDFLSRLTGQAQPSLFSSKPEVFTNPSATHPPVDVETLTLQRVLPLSADSFNGKALVDYLSNVRCIDTNLACKHLVEIRYHNHQKNKTYFAAGIRNEKGGYEIRNPYFKSSIGDKGITIIKGKREGTAAVFEGFIDYLSALTFFQIHNLNMLEQLYYADVIIMNSASFQDRTIELLQQGNYSKTLLFTDNDPTGEKVKAAIIAECPSNIEDCSTIYPQHKDFNQFLQSLTPTKSTRIK